MNLMRFEHFCKYDDMPIFIQYGGHVEDLDMHTHYQYSELVVVLEGHAVHVVNDQEFTVQKGDVYVLNENICHSYKNPQNFQICNVMFKGKEIFKGLFDIEKSAGFQALFYIEPKMAENNLFNARFRLSVDDFQYICNSIDKMIKEYSDKKAGWKSVVIADFIKLAVAFSRFYSDTPNDMNNSSYYLSNTISYINNNFEQDISVSELAKLSNLSERHFLRIFKSIYGFTPTEYINKIRLKKAKHLLKTTDDSISAIALRCGYNSSNYLIRVFKNAFSVTPNIYRKHSYLTQKNYTYEFDKTEN